MTDKTPAPEETQPDPIGEGRKLLAALAENEAARRDACIAEITAVLEKYGMKLHITAPQLSVIPT
jgi:hypothetical protein